ncbi:bifunctional riboflavin kinase/FAD synthetase [Nocardioidaceae bacterium]|nr:bifunctional riboflavin kinase/FAD synthetase [Nocardioidaceae bacterium]
MQLWRDLEEVPGATELGRTVVTIGNFDGVHRGHRAVVRRARAVATDVGVPRVVAVTFDPHPFAVLRPDHAPVQLTRIDERATLLHDAGVDDVLAVPFTKDLAAYSPERFVEEILVDTLHAAAVVVGANFRFGRKASGDTATLVELGATHDFVVEAVDLDGGPQVWSSTYVRTCLAAGDVTGAAEALGRPVTVTGPVERGDQRGRDLGYPTANVAASGAVPADGVYAGWLHGVEDRPLPAAVSVGTNPTFEGERERRVEAYVLDRDDLELYDRTVTVEMVQKVRGMARFDGVEELLEAMAGDVARTRQALGLDPTDHPAGHER